jgi:hypothetical protein
MRRIILPGVALVALLTACKTSQPPAPPPHVQAPPAAPPAETAPAQARLEGTFTKGPLSSEFTFTPTCPTGPCDTRATGQRLSITFAGNQAGKHVGQFIKIGGKGATTPEAALKFDGEAYVGTGHMEAVCSVPDLHVPVTISYKFQVVGSESIQGETRASELRWSIVEHSKKGTFTQRLALGASITTTCKPLTFSYEGVSKLKG